MMLIGLVQGAAGRGPRSDRQSPCLHVL